MRKYKLKWQHGLVGVIDQTNDKEIIPVEYDSIEILLDKYFDCKSDTGRVLLNTRNKVLFNFDCNQLPNHFLVEGNIYKIFCTEQNGNTLIYYGESSDKETSEEMDVLKIIISGNKLERAYCKRAEVEPFF